MDKNTFEIIKRIQDRRNELDMSYQDLADKTGLSKSTLQRYETGFIKNLSIDKVGILADALKVSPAYLMGWEEKNPLEDNIKDLEDAEIITLAAHRSGHEGALSDNDMERVKLAIQIALAKNKK